MTEEQVGAGMYKIGYRIRIILGHMVEQVFHRDLEIAPLYVKTVMEVGPLMRTVYKEHCCDAHYITSDGEKRSKPLEDTGK